MPNSPQELISCKRSVARLQARAFGYHPVGMSSCSSGPVGVKQSSGKRIIVGNPLEVRDSIFALRSDP
jgi:hypothetical protein